MADWPSLPTPCYGSGGETYKPQLRTPFEGGAVQTRPEFTAAPKDRINLRWDNPPLSEADFATFRTFFGNNQGLEITNFPVPGAGGTKTVRFAEDTFQWAWSEYGGREVSVNIEEV